MSSRRATRFGRFAFTATLSILLAGALAAPTAFARIMRNTIDPTATIRDDGRRIVLTGPISCDQSQPALLRVTVTQRSTGAIAQGAARFVCTTDERQWELEASIQGNESFVEGEATAVAVALSLDGGVTDDAHQWLVAITLVTE